MLNVFSHALKLGRRKREIPKDGLRSCCIVTRLALPERDIMLDGVVLQIGPEWARFREAATYLFDRRGEAVLLGLDGDSVPGRIVSTDESGFWIAFDEPLDEDKVRDCALRHGVDPVLVV